MVASTTAAPLPPQQRRLRGFFRKQESQKVQVETYVEKTPDVDEERKLQAITEPLIPQSVWDDLTGDEYPNHPERLDALAQTGARLAENDESDEWIAWKEFGNNNNNNNDIQVWTGRALNKDGYYGGQSPFVKTRSTIPLSAPEMVDLLLDSNRVQMYNPWSLGRQDCWISPDSSQTKIVQNKTQPPLGKKPLVSTTLLHARPWKDNGSWLVVSRAIGGTRYQTFDSDSAARSDILLGVNLLEPLDDRESCQLTAITHVYSSAVPALLAERLGVKSAIKFVKDMRGLKKQQQVAVAQ